MYAVSIRYLRKIGENFNLEHWKQTHMPMGLATLYRTQSVRPVRVMIQHSVVGMDSAEESTDAYATVWLIFESREGLKGFMALHNDPVAAAPLVEDFSHYAPLAPHIALGEVWEFKDIDGLLARGEECLNALDG